MLKRMEVLVKVQVKASVQGILEPFAGEGSGSDRALTF